MVPPNSTTELAVKPEPLTVKVALALPTVADAGEIPPIEGTCGVLVDVGALAVTVLVGVVVVVEVEVALAVVVAVEVGAEV